MANISFKSNPTFLGQLGSGFGTGLGSGLQQLANMKLGELQQRTQRSQTARGLKALLPEANQETIEALSHLESPVLQQYLKSELARPGQEEFARQLGLGIESEPIQQQQELVSSEQPSMDIKKEVVPVKKPRLTEQQAIKVAEHQLKKQKLAKDEQAVIQKETKPYYDQILKEEKSAKDAIKTLNKMEKLIERGKLPPAALYKFVKEIEEKVPPTHGAVAGAAVGSLFGGPTGSVIGAGLGSVINPIASLVESGIKYAYPDTEQFEKLSTSFISGAKNLFGSRITDQDLKVFLQGIPTLYQTEHGKKQIINNMRLFNEAAEVRANALRDILKDNNGKRPENLPILLEEKASKELDRLADEFVNG